MTLYFYLALVFFLFLVISIFAYMRQNRMFSDQLEMQNINILFSDYTGTDIRDELFKSTSFFELNNTGINPNKIKNIEFCKYSTQDDYFM